MKKLLSLVATAVLACGIAFADDAGERSIHWLGFNTAIENQNWKYDDDLDFDISFFDFNIFYNHNSVGDNRFSKIVDVQLGYQSASPDVRFGGNNNAFWMPDFGGFNTRWMFGLGFAPLNIDRVVLTVNGTFGIQMSILTASETYWGYDFDATLFGLGTFIGANCQCAVRLGDSIGLSAGIHLYTNLFGFGFMSYDYGGKDDGDVYAIMPGKVNADFKFGVAWIY